MILAALAVFLVSRDVLNEERGLGSGEVGIVPGTCGPKSNGNLQFTSEGSSGMCRNKSIHIRRFVREWKDLETLGHCHWNVEMDGIMETAGTPRLYALAISSTLYPDLGSVRGVTRSEAQSGHHAAFPMFSFCLKPGQQEAVEQGSKTNFLGLVQ